MLLYFNEVSWINLDPGRTCTFKATEGVFLELYSKNLTASYQEYMYSPTTFACVLNQTKGAQKYANASWVYANDVLTQNPDICAHLITI